MRERQYIVQTGSFERDNDIVHNVSKCFELGLAWQTENRLPVNSSISAQETFG